MSCDAPALRLFLNRIFPFSDWIIVMSAPIKPKTKGRKSKISDGVPSSVQAQAASKPQLLPTVASPSPMVASPNLIAAKGNSVPTSASAGPLHDVGGSVAQEQVTWSFVIKV